MVVCDLLFFLNLLLLVGMTIYHCRKRQFRSIVCNIFVLLLFLSLKFAEIYYVEIRNELFYLLGADRFTILKSILSASLSLGTSITVGFQVMNDFVEIIIFLVLALKAALFCVKKLRNVQHPKSVKNENERISDKNHKPEGQFLFLVYGRLIN